MHLVPLVFQSHNEYWKSPQSQGLRTIGRPCGGLLEGSWSFIRLIKSSLRQFFSSSIYPQLSPYHLRGTELLHRGTQSDSVLYSVQLRGSTSHNENWKSSPMAGVLGNNHIFDLSVFQFIWVWQLRSELASQLAGSWQIIYWIVPGPPGPVFIVRSCR